MIYHQKNSPSPSDLCYQSNPLRLVTLDPLTRHRQMNGAPMTNHGRQADGATVD